MELSTVERFLLLAQHPEKGRFTISGVQLNYGIVGALLLGMSLEKRIVLEDGTLVLKDKKKVKDPLIAEITEIISISDKKRKIKYWINKLNRKSNKYKWTILNEMDRKRLVRIDNKKFLGLIPYKLCYLKDGRTREKQIQHIRKAILHPSSVEITNDDIVIMGLVEACKMHKTFATNKEELKKIRKELKEIIKNSPIAEAMDKTIKEVQGAIVATMIATTVVIGGGR